MYFLALLYMILFLMALFLLWQVWRYFSRMRLYKKIKSTPFSPEDEVFLQKLPHYRLLPYDLKKVLQDSIRFFIATKEFRGVELEVTRQMQLVIAFYACLLQIKRRECYENLKTIIIYPNDVITRRVEANGGIFREGDFVLEGESSGGSVVIAWNEAKREALHPKGHNVIVHEMAHELDFEDGAADGVPLLAIGRYAVWSQVMYKEFEKLKAAFAKGRDLGKYAWIGSYAATNEAEFFAVVSELFFEKPWLLKKHFRDIYDVLKDFYGLDTAEIFKGLEKRE